MARGRSSLLVLGLALALGSGALVPSGTRADTRPGEPLPDLEELEAHIAGMEGKLRDSAAARKAADQARMEAERRLAASQQREAELSADIERLTQVQAILEEALSEALLTQARLAAQAAANASAARELSALRATLPPSLGGTLAAEQARAGAAAAFAELEAEGASPTTRPQSLARLHREQLLLALATNAQGVYRVRPQDSLALIAGRLLGASTRWEDLFAANRHLLNDPDRLMPGVTLVVP